MQSSSDDMSMPLEKNRYNKNRKTILCSKCGKEKAKKACTLNACFKCCDDYKCVGHKHQRIMDGSSWINKQAAKKRALAIQKGLFRESAFRYLGETLLVWDFKEFMSIPKWRDDAIRRSRKNRELFFLQNVRRIDKRRKGGRKKRFEQICAKLLHNIENKETKMKTLEEH